MRVKTKDIVIGILFILLISLFWFTSKDSQITEQTTQQTKEWQVYSDQNLGIKIKYPGWVKPFSEKSVYFAECEDCMGLLSVQAYKIYNQEIDEVYKDYKGSEYVVGKIKIDGKTALETIPYEEYTTLSNSRKYYVIHGNYLYKIYDRLNQNETDREYFLENFSFSSGISQTQQGGVMR